MDTIPIEILCHILDFLPPYHVIVFGRTSHLFHEISIDVDYWRSRVHTMHLDDKKFDRPMDSIRLNPFEKYMMLAAASGNFPHDCVVGSERFINPMFALIQANMTGNACLGEYFRTLIPSYNDGLPNLNEYISCVLEYKNVDVARHFVSEKRLSSLGMYYDGYSISVTTALSGVDIVFPPDFDLECIMSVEKDEYPSNSFYEVLENGGDVKEILELLAGHWVVDSAIKVSFIVSVIDNRPELLTGLIANDFLINDTNFNRRLYFASVYLNHIRLAEIMCKQTDYVSNEDIRCGYLYAAWGNHAQDYDDMAHITGSVVIDQLLIGYTRGGHVESFRQLYTKERRYACLATDALLQIACQFGETDIVEIIIGSGIDKFPFRVVEYAIKRGSLDIIDILIEHGFPASDSILTYAARHHKIDLIEYAIKMGLVNDGKYEEILTDVIVANNIRTFKTLIKLRRPSGITDLILTAIREGKIEFVKVLLPICGDIFGLMSIVASARSYKEERIAELIAHEISHRKIPFSY